MAFLGHYDAQQRQIQELQHEVTRLRTELAEVVDEYNVLEREAELKEGTSKALAKCLADMSRATFVSIQSVWHAHTSGADEATMQKAVMAAISQPEAAQRALHAAGYVEYAEIATSDDISDLLESVKSFSPDATHRQEKRALQDRIKDLDDRYAQTIRVLGETKLKVTAVEKELEEAEQQKHHLERELNAVKQSVGAFILVDGHRYDADAVQSLQTRIQQLQTEVQTYSAKSLSAVLSDVGSDNVTAIAQETAAALTRATEAEARAEQLSAQLLNSSIAHDTEMSKLRLELSTLEHANSQLSRTVNSLRSELDIIQEKYTAREGVVSMLQQELADTHARLARLQVHKTEMAQKAAAALRDMETQVNMLTAAVHALKAQKTAPNKTQLEETGASFAANKS